MKKSKYIKLLLSTMVFISLIGCGGGGGSGSDKDKDEDAEIVFVRDPEPVKVAPIKEVTYDKGVKKTGQTQSYNLKGLVELDEVIEDDGYYQKGVDPSYSRDNNKETVVDNITGLMWQDNKEVSTNKREWDLSTAYCNELVLGGYQDWRVPNIKELQSIVSFSKSFPSLDPKFKNVASTTNIYWTSSQSTKIDNSIWTVRFNYGYTMHLDKDVRYYIRCVREK